MEQESFFTQPETAWYEKRLRKQRRFRLITGIMILCATLFLFISNLIHFPFHDTLSLVAFVILSLLLISFGVSEILANWGPVPVEKINQLRQYERLTLFRQAQGLLPWQFHPWVRVVELLLATFSFWLAASHTVLVTAERTQWVMAGIYLLAGFSLLVDALYFKPRWARQLAARSAAELASRLRIGEATGNRHADTGIERL
jgi:hypothetical protein